jgi:hypothetical protein
MALLRSEFSDQLRRICGGCALAFLLCIIVAVLLDARGIGGKLAATIITLLPLAFYCAAGLATSTANRLNSTLRAGGFPQVSPAWPPQPSGARRRCFWLRLALSSSQGMTGGRC